MEKRRTKFVWRATDDKHVTILSRLIDPQDNGGELAQGPQHTDLMVEACGLSPKSHAVTTVGEKKLDNNDETLLSWDQTFPSQYEVHRLDVYR